MKITEIRNLFSDPPKEYRIAPFWFLNYDFDEAELRRQIGEMDEKGVGGAILHPRHGMKVPYMSEEFLQMIGVCIDEMDQRGMKAWLYDENNWPSGTYDGELTRNHPEYRMRYIRIESIKVQGETLWNYPLKYEEDNTIMEIQAARYEEREGNILVDQDSIVNIGDRLENGSITWKVPQGEWLICLFWECVVPRKVTYKNGYYLDTMNEEAVGEFIRLAYEPYMRFQSHFGGTVMGVFTDEPGLMIHDSFIHAEPIRTKIDDLGYNLSGYVLAWTRDFFHKFKSLKGYDFGKYLFALLYDIGEETHQIRLDYYDALNTWYVDSYHRAIGTWCRQRGLKYIGHTLEEPLWGQVRTQGNQTKVLQQMDYPGYDYLGQGVGTKKNPHRILAAKCASSVAHIEGKKRVMCESFGGGGHSHSLYTRKLDANFMALLGTNMYIPHAFYYSFEGYRKTDWPPTEFYHAPHWPYYRGYGDYLGRLSLLQSLGTHKAVACILSPVKTVSVEMFDNGKGNTAPESDGIFSRVSDLLLRCHLDYDYVDDCQVKEALIKDGRLGFPNTRETFTYIILPGVKIISLESARKIKAFYEDGGRIVIIGNPPCEGDKLSENDEVQRIFHDIITDGQGKGQVLRMDYSENFEDEFIRAADGFLHGDVSIMLKDGTLAEDVLYSRRDMGDMSVYFLFNRTMEETEVTVSFHQKGYLHEWNLEDGSVQSVEEAEDGIIRLKLWGAQIRVIAISEEAPLHLKNEMEYDKKHILALDGPWDFRPQTPNVFKLDEWMYKTRDWDAMAKERVSGTPGQVNSYTAVFEVQDIPLGEVWMVFDDIKQWIPSHVGFLSRTRSLEIYINGNRLETLQPSPWQEKYYLQARVDGMLQKGPNKVEIHTISLLNPMHGLTEPVYILGDFTVQQGRISAAEPNLEGYWSENGYPYYSGIGTYRKSFNLDKDPSALKALSAEIRGVRDGCAVKINGHTAGIRYWPPYEVGILPYVQKGENYLEIEVFNTLENLYGKKCLPSGIIGAVIEGC